MARPRNFPTRLALLRAVFTFVAYLAGWMAARPAESVALTDSYQKGDFNLVQSAQAADLFVNRDDFKVVHIAADCLVSDIKRVTGVQAHVCDQTAGLSENAVIIGTLGSNPVIDHLAAAGRLNITGIKGKWESFLITTVTDPLPGVHEGLVVAGSDRRGTAYGVFTLSEAIGVTPWVWYADATPTHRDSLILAAGTHGEGPPSVKYRGIFLNDEDWALHPWAAKTYEPETDDIGPKTYAAICELLLRLKANYLWPAMHPCTKAFNIYPQNKIVADDYGIVMGSSHTEPMLRDNVTEWTLPKAQFNYATNRSDIDKYWEQRVLENGRYENVYTLGIRGIHDSGMEGGGATADKVARMQQVFADQRDILARHVNPDVTTIPQIFTPYKEVLTLYQNGLQAPADVTLVWPDDNYGYIRELPTDDEQKRSGGSGIYYHVSYWGKPEDYLWLCTTPPALIWEEMGKAYDNGARNVWVLNVGDLKPAEIDMEFFLRMAWNITAWNETAEPTFLTDWAKRGFGPQHAAEIASILEEYYRLNYAAKPEHLDSAHFTDNYNEISDRLKRFAQIVSRTNTIYDQIPAEKKDAFYELIVYPVRCSALMNQRHLGGSPAERQKAWDQIQTETSYYNEQLAKGKWRYYMSADPRNQPVFQKPDAEAPPAPVPDVDTGAAHSAPDGGYISVDADHPARKGSDAGAAWKVIAGLGPMEDAMTLLPTTAPVSDADFLEYDFTTAAAGGAKVLVYCVPTHAFHPGEQARYFVSIDGEPPQIVNIDTKENGGDWKVNVLRNTAIGMSSDTLAAAGPHSLRLHPLDPGLVFEKIVVDLGGLKPTRCGPPENTRDHKPSFN